MDRINSRTVGLAMWMLAGACSNGGGQQAAQATPAAQQPAPAAAAQPAAPSESAHDVFTTRCVPCHGSSGRGDGPASVALNPKPRNYTDVQWQKQVTDEQLKQTILYGGAAVGKSPVMPSQPDLESKPETLAGLIKIIRDFGVAH